MQTAVRSRKEKFHKFGRTLSNWSLPILPIGFTIWLKYYPIFRAFYISLFRYDPIHRPGKFLGLDNYKNLMGSSYYWQSWRVTFAYLGLRILMTFFVPIIQALFLNEITRFSSTFTTMYIIPSLVPTTVNVIVWKWIWNPDYGMANYLLGKIGIEPQTWLSDPKFTLFCIVFPSIVGGGMSVLLYLSAIQGISPDIVEASAIDGCTGWKRIWYITLPNIRFLILIQLILSVIGNMQSIDTPYLYTKGGPSGASTTMGIFIYNSYNEDFNYGRGSAAAVVLFIIIAIMTSIQLSLEAKYSD